jgi:hypothetical protein
MDDLGPPKFPSGHVVATSNALATLNTEDTATAISRHLRGDWGELCEEDRLANERALKEGTRLFSVYKDRNNHRFYVITEWDRSATTILLPEDY